MRFSGKHSRSESGFNTAGGSRTTRSRLFRKESYLADHQEVHGGFRMRGARGRLDGVFYHYTYDTIYSYIAKMNDYTSLEVSNRWPETPRPGPAGTICCSVRFPIFFERLSA